MFLKMSQQKSIRSSLKMIVNSQTKGKKFYWRATARIWDKNLKKLKLSSSNMTMTVSRFQKWAEQKRNLAHGPPPQRPIKAQN